MHRLARAGITSLRNIMPAGAGVACGLITSMTNTKFGRLKKSSEEPHDSAKIRVTLFLKVITCSG